MIELLTKKDLKLAKIKSYKKDDVLFHELDNCTEVGFVSKGELIIKSFDSDGKEIIYNNIKQNEMFGNNLLFSNDKKYKGDVIAISNSEILYFNKTDLLEILNSNIPFLESYLINQANNTKKLNFRVKLLSLDKAKDRFMFYLKANENKIEYESITSLAKELNIERETLSRLISQLVKNKVVVQKDKTITTRKAHR